MTALQNDLPRVQLDEVDRKDKQQTLRDHGVRTKMIVVGFAPRIGREEDLEEDHVSDNVHDKGDEEPADDCTTRLFPRILEQYLDGFVRENADVTPRQGDQELLQVITAE